MSLADDDCKHEYARHHVTDNLYCTKCGRMKKPFRTKQLRAVVGCTVCPYYRGDESGIDCEKYDRWITSSLVNDTTKPDFCRLIEIIDVVERD